MEKFNSCLGNAKQNTLNDQEGGLGKCILLHLPSELRAHTLSYTVPSWYTQPGEAALIQGGKSRAIKTQYFGLGRDCQDGCDSSAVVKG